MPKLGQRYRYRGTGVVMTVAQVTAKEVLLTGETFTWVGSREAFQKLWEQTMPKKQTKRKPETWWCIQNGDGELVPGTNSRNRRDAITLFVTQGDEYRSQPDVDTELWNFYSKQRGYRVVRIEVRCVESKQ